MRRVNNVEEVGGIEGRYRRKVGAGTKEREYPFPAKQFFSKNDSQNEMYEILYKSGKMVI